MDWRDEEAMRKEAYAEGVRELARKGYRSLGISFILPLSVPDDEVGRVLEGLKQWVVEKGGKVYGK